MKKNLIKLSLFLFSILFVNSVFSQSNKWELYYSDNQIKIEYTYMICDFSSTASQEIIIFRFTNLSENHIILNYETQTWYDDKKTNTEQNVEEFRKTVSLEKDEIITTNCEDQWNGHSIFSAFIHKETSERWRRLIHTDEIL